MPYPHRVKDEAGNEFTTAVVYDGLTEVDKPAVDAGGNWLPLKAQNDLLTPKQQDEATPATTEATPAAPEAEEATE